MVEKIKKHKDFETDFPQSLIIVGEINEKEKEFIESFYNIKLRKEN